jgi:hypothetical protein
MRYWICLLAFGCSGNNQINITKTVGTEGGVVSGSDGTSVNVPMGALGMSTNITITPVTVTAPPGTVLVGPAYDFGPNGTQFSTPVTITLPYDPAKIPSGHSASEIVIYTAPSGTTNYTATSTTFGSSSNTVQTSASHFTVYLPAAPTGGGPPMDLGSCTPNCTSTSTTCGCTETCNGHTYVMMCSGSTTVSCFCEIDGATQTNPINYSGPCNASETPSVFFSSCAPG